MKKSFLFILHSVFQSILFSRTIALILTLGFLQISFAQGVYTEAQRKKDKAKLDSICKKSPNSCIYYDDLIGPTSVFRNHRPIKINRSRGICFNKKIEFMSNTNGVEKNGCYFLNTETGYVAMFMSNLSQSCSGMSNPQPGFDMIITSKIGESFIFRISNRGVRTFMAQMPIDDYSYERTTNFTIKNPISLQSTFREPFTNLNLPTLGYVINGAREGSTKYLFGMYHAQQIPLKDYIGAFGTGYYSDGLGNTFIALAVESPNNFVKIKKIIDVNECFDGSSFKDATPENTQANNSYIEDEERKLNNLKTSGSGNNCDASNTLLQHKEKVLKKQKDYNNYLKSGGNTQSKEGLKLAVKSQDIIDQVITHRLETEEKICDAEYTIEIASKEYNGASAITRANTKIQCYSTAIRQLNELQRSLEAIDTRNGSNFPKSMGEKNVLYMNSKKNIDTNCNLDKSGNVKKNPLENGASEFGNQLKELMKRK